MSSDDLIARIAERHAVGAGAVEAAWAALRQGGGRMAQFSHPEFGGMAQWSKGGMAMVGAMFDDAVKAKFVAVMNDLAAAWDEHGPGDGRDALRGEPSRKPDDAGGCWPANLGAPSPSGSQNDMRYAFFRDARRLIVQDGEKRRIFDTGRHVISGVSQQQSTSRTLAFETEDGSLKLEDLSEITE